MAQMNRLKRQIKIWRTLYLGTKDVICFGDTNLCALKWLEDGYKHKDLSEMMHNFMVESGSVQIIKEHTRSELI